MPEGRCRAWLFLVFCVLFGICQGKAETLPTVVLLSPQEDAYFFPFLEVFLRRTLPGYEIVTLSPRGILPPREEYVIVGFPQELQRVQLPEGKVSCILLGEADSISFPLLGQITFLWQETATTICKKLCATGGRRFLFVGKGTHPLFMLLTQLCGTVENSEEPVMLLDRVSSARAFLKERGGFPFLVVLEAATEMLFALQEGRIYGVVDTKPSQVAQCIAAIVQGKSTTCTVTPLFVTRGNISSADAYEVVRRCFSCH